MSSENITTPRGVVSLIFAETPTPLPKLKSFKTIL